MSNTQRSVARVLGFKENVLGHTPPRSLAELADGTVLASYASFCIHVRGKLPSSLAVELADLQRALSHLATAAPSGTRAELETLRATLRRLCRQLMALPRPEKPSVDDLTKAGRFCSLERLWSHIDASYSLVDFDDRTRQGARRVHDNLMLFLCLREHCVKRPSCMWLAKVPGASGPCSLVGCTKPSCRGNSWRAGGDSPVLELVHFKTERTHGGRSVMTVERGSRTELLLTAYSSWARALLLAPGQEKSESLWLNHSGRPFSSGKRFAAYLPSLLLPCVKVTWTTLRHIAAVSLCERATADELEGLAAAMQTSTHAGPSSRACCSEAISRAGARKLTSVYQSNRREVQALAGASLYRGLAKSNGVPAGAQS